MFERSFTILPSDAGTGGVIKPRNLTDCLQDTADMAARELKADVHSVMDKGYAWILVHVKISVDRWPELGEKITIRTWHNVNDGLYTFRAFDARSADEKALLSGSTSWLLLDLARSRPVKPKNILDAESNPPVPSEFIELPREISENSHKKHKKNFEVRLHDLDANDHVNNAVYIEWAVESVPSEILRNCQLSGWDVIYRKGARLGDEVMVNTQEEPIDEKNSPIKTFTGIMNAGGTFLCTVRTYWR